ISGIDPRTMQEQGDNMLGMVRYFGHTNQLDANAADAGEKTTHGNDTFFNVVGPVMIHYSPTLNFMLLLLANLLVLLSLGYGLMAGRISLRQLLLGALIFIVTLAVLYFIARWTLQALRTMYPLYEGYYPNRYNTGYFYITLAAESALLFTLLYRWPLRRWSLSSLFMAVLIIQLLLLDVLYYYIPAGVYWLDWPLIGAAAAFPFLPAEKSRNARPPRYWPGLVALLPAILLLTPMVYSLALTFDIQGEAAINAVVMGLLLGLTLPLLKPAFRESGWLLPVIAFGLFLIAGIAGIACGGYDTQQPFKTDLQYLVRTGEHTASWGSNEVKADWFTKPYLSGSAPFLDLPGPELRLNKGYEDTTGTQEESRYDINCQPPPGARSIHLSFDPYHLPTAIRIDGKDYKGPIGRLDYVNPGNQEFELLITVPRGTKLHIVATSSSLGLPTAAGFKGYPPDVIPFPGPYANTTMVQRTYDF
ncbi:MAG TPA: hypothetical protein VGS79_23285, partial [Puia sp.]|nr:hypothetical protein [Puia sp.]